MEKPTSVIDRVTTRCGRQRARRGYTLVESMIASVLLSICVVGVSGSILSSYAHDNQSKQQHDATRSAEELRDELTALPMTAASTSDVGLMDFASYSDTVPADQIVVASAAKQSTKQTTAGTSGTSSASTSNTGLLGSVVGIVNGVLGAVLGTSNSGSNQSGNNQGDDDDQGNNSGSGNATSTATATDAKTGSGSSSLSSLRVVQVSRYATLGGATSSTGELAVVTIDVTVGGTKVRVKRLVSATEAASNTAGSTQ